MIKQQIDNDFFGTIGNDFILNNNINDCSHSTYAVMRTLFFNGYRNCSVLSLESLYDVFGASCLQSTQTRVIHNAILELVKMKYIKLYDIYNNPIEFSTKYKGLYKVSFLLEDEDNNFIADGGFTKIPEVNLIAILKCLEKNKGIKKYQLIRFYLFIARKCSNDNQMFKITQKDFFNNMKISSKTCVNWSNILKEAGVIYYNNDYGCSIGGKFNYTATVYFHRNNNEIGSNTKEMSQTAFDGCMENYAKENGLVKIDKKAMNNKRSENMKEMWQNKKS